MRSMVRQPHFDTDLPYELRCLEAALDGALSVMDIETTKLEADATPLVRRASQKVRLQRTHAENGQGGHTQQQTSVASSIGLLPKANSAGGSNVRNLQHQCAINR